DGVVVGMRRSHIAVVKHAISGLGTAYIHEIGRVIVVTAVNTYLLEVGRGRDGPRYAHGALNGIALGSQIRYRRQTGGYLARDPDGIGRFTCIAVYIVRHRKILVHPVGGKRCVTGDVIGTPTVRHHARR